MPAVLIWVQSLLGTGHLRRMFVLGGALARRGHRVAIANGGLPPPWPAPAGVAVVGLEPVLASDTSFAALVDADGRPAGDTLWHARHERLSALARDLRPDLVVTEMFPFGRRAFGRELLPWLAEIRERRPETVFASSVRDVLVSKPRAERYQEMAELVRRWFDIVVVHADPSLVPFGASFPDIRAIQDRLRYAGYLADANGPAAVGAARAGVVVSAGGGAVGGRLLACALEARTLSRLANEGWTLVCGARGDADRLRELCGGANGVTVLEHDPELPLRIAAARVSVSQAGYNTVVETLAAGTPMVLVPFGAEGEDEQTRRARALAARGFARLLPEAELTAEGLAQAVDAAAAAEPPPLRIAIDRGERAAALLEAAVAAGERR